MTETTFADDLDVRKGAIVRLPAVGKSRPYCLKIVSREPVSQATGAIVVVGEVLGLNGTTSRRKPVIRQVVLVVGRYEFFHKIPHFTAKLATLRREGGSTMELITCWGVVNDETGEALSTGSTGPAVVDMPCSDGSVYRYVQVGDWEGRPTPWLARGYCTQTEYERSHRIDEIGQCVNKVRTARGILRIERLVYDCSTWNHWSRQELRDVEGGMKAWRDTYVCRHCGRDLVSIGHSPWFRAADGTTECDAEEYVP
jgi:hypothetical protein